MISPELLRRYPFFAGLSHDQMVTLAKVADELMVETGHYFFREGDELKSFYLVLEGVVAIGFELPDQEVEQPLAQQLKGKLQTKDAIISAIGPGEIFAWSALVPPHQSTACGKATTSCRVISFNCQELLGIFETDCRFGYLMMQKAAQIARDRLHDTRVEALAHTVA